MDVELLGVRRVRCRTVTADPEDHRIACFQLWPISLIGFEFTASGFGEGQDVENEHHVLLAVKI